MLRLKSIEIRNFRAIEHANVALDPHLTVLVGDNAAGKTAILDAIAAALSSIIYGRQPRPTQSVAPKDFRVVGLANPMGEVRQEENIYLGVEEHTFGGWECHFHLHETIQRQVVSGGAEGSVPYKFRDMLDDSDFVAPIVASYGADRASPSERSPNMVAFAKRRISAPSRRRAYAGALSSRAVYEEAIDWFEAIENLELRNNREASGIYRDHRLDAVRKAVSQLVPQLSNQRMVGLPPRLMVDAKLPGRPVESLSIDQLSGGYRVMLALVMDLARRMAELNPTSPDPLGAEGVVLIDEIDLHLHPKWQQLVVSALRSTFPAVQFILTTHSPQVLTTLRPENVYNLKWIDGQLIRAEVPSTSGAEAGRLMSEVMGVDERPPPEVSSFVGSLENYRDLVARGRWDTPEAIRLLDGLRRTSPDDPVLGVLDLEQRRLASQKRRSAGEV